MTHAIRVKAHRSPKELFAFLLLLLFAPALAWASQPIVVEAETGTLTGTEVATTRAGFTGSGYVTGFTASGDKLTVTVQAPEAGTYDLSIRYASEFGDKTNDVYVNDILLSRFVFKQSVTFATAAIGSVSLNQGANKIEIRHNWGYFDVDNFAVALPPPPVGGPIVLEAENGQLTGTMVATTRPGFTGTGYVTGFDAAGDKVVVTATVAEAGTYTLGIRYASPFGDKTNDVYVNGVLLSRRVFTTSTTFTLADLGAVSLNKGDNTLEIRHNWGYFDVDNFTLTPPPPPIVILEAEQGTLTGTVVSTQRAGYTGSGYVTGFDGSGKKVAVTMNAPAAGLYKLAIRYASEFGDKTNDVFVNGALVRNQVFAKSATFTMVEVGNVSLTQGVNVLEVRHNWGYFDVDHFALTPPQAGANTAPMAKAGKEQVKVVQGTGGQVSFLLDGSGSTDAEQNINFYEWKNQAGTVIGTTAQVQTEALPIGDYEFTLTARDTEGLSATDKVKVFVGEATNFGHNRLDFRNGREMIFASGINLAWKDYSRDIVALDDAYFAEVLTNIQNAGGNALRWWLHTNGRFSPEFGADGTVTGINHSDISNLRRVLDMAYERGISISMCLWSFDILQPQGQDQAVMKRLLEDPAVTRTYIDNALVPLLKEIGTHPAVMTWEIFNEGEGLTREFGWTPVRSEMKYVQQFTNLLAGAIHRQAPGALVSTSAWSFRALTDKDGNHNYYSNERLIAAGGDPDGTLDFYQVHFYPQHFDNSRSPFHRPASYWGLDKPIVIGEYPEIGVQDRVDPHYSLLETFQLAYAYGYAGAIPWNYPGYRGNGFADVVESLTYMRQNHPEDINIGPVADFNYAPKVVAPIPNANFLLNDKTKAKAYADLKTIFSDPEDGNRLTYSITKNDNPALVAVQLGPDGTLDLFLVKGVEGLAQITVKATDSQGAGAYHSFQVQVKDPKGNLALFEPIFASSNESGSRPADLANDGLLNSRWSSAYADDQWIYVDLEKKETFNQVKLYWEFAYGKSYDIQVSDDAQSWTTVFSETNSDGGEDLISFAPVKARYVRLLGLTRGTPYGFSLWEFEVYNDGLKQITPPGLAEDEVPIVIFPNPAKSFIHLQTPFSDSYSLYIYDYMGTLKDSREVNTKHLRIDVSSWQKGLYTLKFYINGSIQTKKVLLQ